MKRTEEGREAAFARSEATADFDKTVDLIEQENAEPDPTTFEIAVSTSASPWPEAATGVKGVLAAVQHLLVAATEGNSCAFDTAEAELDEALFSWHADLFGTPEKP